DGNVESLRGMGHFQPGRDAADAADVDLDDVAAALLHVFAKMPDRVERLADSDGRGRRTGKPDMAVYVVGGQGLFDPGEVQFAQAPGSADRLVHGKALIAVRHDLVVVAERLA